MKKTVLIVGITSFVGSNLAEVLSSTYRVVGTYFTKREALPNRYLMLPCNVLNKEELKRAIRFFQPDYVIYAVGISSLSEAKKRGKETEALNVTGAVNCLNIAERAGALFIYLSSAYALSGENKFFKEADAAVPITTYGTTVANAEFYIQRSSLHYLILRCPVLYGLSYSTHKLNIFELLQKSVFTEKKLTLDDHAEVGFLDVQLLARFIMILLEKNIINRLLQISSKDQLSFFKFSQLYAQVFKSTSSLFVAEKIPFPVDIRNEPSQLSFRMDVTNTESRIGIKMPTVQESLTFTKSRLSEKSS